MSKIEELKIAKELNYLFSDNEVEVSKILEKYNIAKFDAIAITKLVFDLSKQLSKIILEKNDSFDEYIFVTSLINHLIFSQPKNSLFFISSC